jgi:acetolactate synthase-1/2/3 large subunit
MDVSRTVATQIGKTLFDLGARHCFGLIGTANFKVTHALTTAGVRYIAARHEGNAAAMADAYSKATGELDQTWRTHRCIDGHNRLRRRRVE